MPSDPFNSTPHTAHPAHDLFPVVTDREWARSLRRARAERNEIREHLRERFSEFKLKRARRDGL